MLITALEIQNYRSLRSLNLAPKRLTVLVGANASGKSNVADCLDFISEIYRHGLEVAIARKGGYENIAHTKKKRSRSVSIAVNASYTAQNDFSYSTEEPATFEFQATHSFTFSTAGSAIRADYRIVREFLSLRVFLDEKWVQLLTITRNRDVTDAKSLGSEKMAELFPFLSDESVHFLAMDTLKYLLKNKSLVAPSNLVAVAVSQFVGPLRDFAVGLGGIRVFQINPSTSRQFGTPTPGPEVSRAGENLPAAIDLLQKNYPNEWESVMEAMRRILPALERIQIGYTTARTLGLFFHERGFSRAWTAGEVSDGTIQTLALLTAIFDPRSKALVIEEPENSVHPWIIRNLLAACEHASRSKQIIITTHSPIVVNGVSPSQVWVIWRRMGESHLAPLLTLDTEFAELWNAGTLATFDLLDSGAILQAVPPADLPPIKLPTADAGPLREDRF